MKHSLLDRFKAFIWFAFLPLILIWDRANGWKPFGRSSMYSGLNDIYITVACASAFIWFVVISVALGLYFIFL